MGLTQGHLKKTQGTRLFSYGRCRFGDVANPSEILHLGGRLRMMREIDGQRVCQEGHA
jgi:hypothetical protein